MKYLLAICYILFFIPFIGKFIFPILISNWIVNWFLIILLSILLPIGYAKSLTDCANGTEKAKKPATTINEFLFIFCLSIGLHVFSSQTLIATDNLLNAMATEKVNSAEIFQLTYKDHAEKNNRGFAQIIYWRQGVLIQYKLNSGAYKLFEPSQSDIDMYRENVELKNKKQALNAFNKEQSIIAMYFSLFQIVSFLLITKLSLYLLESKAKAIKSDP
ncbi:hypothetical protein RGQ13_16190 [Thalassotalea psychrophila]|uniref:Uncharacterized protein n=1 Tax=Thalassotalea psychrophila TaxID=3065647 RepID=A0ABY9TT76_9GAMM|nr:hypothetical protein RGQ13_16190 [Colwelliaceae bacterium SQ149]